MLLALEEDMLTLLAESLGQTVASTDGAQDEDLWQYAMVVLVARESGASACEHFRPISIFPVLWKVFSTCLGKLAGSSLDFIALISSAFTDIILTGVFTF